MKRKAMFTSIFIMLLLAGLSAEAGIKPRAAGIGVRGTYWRSNATQPDLTVFHRQGVAEINAGGGGGWLYFFSRIDNEWIFDFSLGAIGEAKTKESYTSGNHVKVKAIIPILFGLRHDLFSIYSRSALQPYICFGGGPYWLNDISVQKQYFADEENVNIKTKLKAGGYAGGGMNFMLSSFIGLNFAIKYHFVDFNVNHEYSGWEYGFGLFLTWGRYRSSRR